MKHNILIADDHKMFLDGLYSILQRERDFRILYTADNGDDLLKFIDNNKDEKIDLVITDISMPGKTGVEVNSYIKEHYPLIKTLVVSMHNNPKKIEQLSKNKVDGYLLKNAEKTELLKAIQKILSGEKYFSQEIKDTYLKQLFAKKESQELNLTQREIDVIKLIAQEYTTQEIADKLYLSKHTIESYRKNLMSKLQVKNIAGLTKYAIRLGYVDA